MSCPGTSGNRMASEGPSSDLFNRGRVAAVEGPAGDRDDRLTAEVTSKDGASNETARTPIEVARRLAFLLTVACKPRTWSRRLREPARLPPFCGPARRGAKGGIGATDMALSGAGCSFRPRLNCSIVLRSAGSFEWTGRKKCF